MSMSWRIAPQLRDLDRLALIQAIKDGRALNLNDIIFPLILGGAGDFIAFNQGQQQVVTNGKGYPSTCYFDLSTKPTQGSGALAAADTFAGGYGVLTGTGYAVASQALPSPTGLGGFAFTLMSWATGSATDWTSPKSIVLIDKSGGGGSEKLVMAWDLVAGGAARDMSQANTTLNVTPTYAPTNP
jgi:hypothetical protein